MTKTTRIFWKTSSYSDDIIAVQAVGETAEYITYLYLWCGKVTERRERKNGRFFPTWEAANAALIANLEENIQTMSDQLHDMKSHLDMMKSRKPPP